MNVINVRRRLRPDRVAQNAYIERSQLTALERLADQEERSISFLIREAIDTLLEQRSQAPRP